MYFGDDLSSLFCSKLVAAVYKHVGLIGPDRTLGDFLRSSPMRTVQLVEQL